ncbi:hypothetical protein [Oleomonas cavernae]|uniref:hypothetical protein n=1 Tax=Oleomonas cavernae TaxID=2320859 RepID=UPI0013140900|nr:hypothetical protein [Oleomonas cavernae]
MFLMVAQDELPGVPPGGLSFAHVREVVNAHIEAVARAAPARIMSWAEPRRR